MNKEESYKKLKEEIDNCDRPMIIFDGDPDGTTSFIQFYRYKGDGKGIMVKASPQVTIEHARKVTEYGADKVFIFDLAMVDQEFIDECKVPVVWVDHHAIQERHGNVLYINPRNWGETTPPCAMIYEALGKDLWISVMGCIADWHLHPNLKEFQEKFPGWIDIDYKYPEDIYFKTKLSLLIKVLSFNLKGTTSDAMKSIKIFTRIEHPDEILDQSTAKGKFVWKKYETINKVYSVLKERAVAEGDKAGRLFIFTYTANQTSVTRDLANELTALYPDKVIVLAREKSGSYKMSLRAGREAPPLRDALARALVGIVGGGGGHEKACGAHVLVDDFSRFIENFERELSL